MRGGRSQIWVAAGATAVGVLIAFTASHRVPPWWLLMVLLVAPLLFNRARIRRLGHASDVRTGSQRKPDPRQRVQRATAQQRHDARGTRASRVPHPESGDEPDVIGRIHDVLDERRLQWLRTNDFDTPWLHAQVQPLVDLRPLLIETANQSLDPDWVSVLAPLAGAVDRFVVFYEAHVGPDPTLVGDEWRSLKWEPESAAPPEASMQPSLNHKRSTELRAFALEVAESYVTFAARLSKRIAHSSDQAEETRWRGGASERPVHLS